MSPEDAHAVSAKISMLQATGKRLLPEEPSRTQDGASIESYKRQAWLDEVSALVQRHFEKNPTLVSVAKELNTGNTNEPLSSQPVGKALDLLETVQGYIFVESQGNASDSLKLLIEQTLRDRYFQSWEVRLLVASFALVFACLFGGTVYLGTQVQGVANQADIARKSIEVERTSIVTLGNEAIDRIRTRAEAEAKDQVSKLDKAIGLSTGTIERLRTKAEGGASLLETATKTGEKSIQDAAEREINKIPSIADGRVAQRLTDLFGLLQTQVSVKAKDADDQIQKQIESLNRRKQNFLDELPEAVKFADNRTKEFNDIVSRYSGRIDDILSRFSGNEKLPAIQSIAKVLGAAVWLMIGAVSVSIIALIVAVASLIGSRSGRASRGA